MKTNYTQLQLKEIYDRYKNGELIRNMADEIGVDPGNLGHALKRRGFLLRSTQKSTDSTKLFSDEASLHYWSGFIATDGNLYKSKESKSHVISLYLNGKDFNHLIKLHDLLDAESEVSITKNRGEARFRFRNKEFTDFLLENGVSERKTHTLRVSEVLANSSDFWRGCIDGDGCIYSRKNKYGKITPYIFLATASEEFANQYLSFLTKNGIRGYKSLDRQKYFRVNVTSKYEIVKLVQLLKYGEGLFAMERKEDKAVELMHAISHEKILTVLANVKHHMKSYTQLVIWPDLYISGYDRMNTGGTFLVIAEDEHKEGWWKVIRKPGDSTLVELNTEEKWELLRKLREVSSAYSNGEV